MRFIAGRLRLRGLSIMPSSQPTDAAALPDALPLSLVCRRPDIVASRWRVEAAQGDIESARAQFYPNINLSAFTGFSTLALDRVLDAGSRIVGIGSAIRLPVFEGGRLRAQLKGRVAGYDNTVASYNQTLTDALRDVADQVRSLRAAEAQGGHQRAGAGPMIPLSQALLLGYPPARSGMALAFWAWPRWSRRSWGRCWAAGSRTTTPGRGSSTSTSRPGRRAARSRSMQAVRTDRLLVRALNR